MSSHLRAVHGDPPPADIPRPSYFDDDLGPGRVFWNPRTKQFALREHLEACGYTRWPVIVCKCPAHRRDDDLSGWRSPRR